MSDTMTSDSDKETPLAAPEAAPEQAAEAAPAPADQPEAAAKADDAQAKTDGAAVKTDDAKAKAADAAKSDGAAAKSDDAAAKTEGEGKDDEKAEGPSAAPELPADEMSFAELFELAEKAAAERKQSNKKGKEAGGVYAGHVLEAKVVGFSHDSVFFAVDGQREGLAPKTDFENDDGDFTLKEGDTVEVRVLSTEGATIKLGKVLAHQSVKTREAIEEAAQAGIPVEGKITGQNKGGFDVSIQGLRAFLPSSQVDLRPVENPAGLIGQKFSFKITEFKDKGRNIVVSRRVLLAEERKVKAEAVMATLSVDMETYGTVTSVKDYGAFVDIGGVEGLVHVSEISHSRVVKAGDIVKQGDQVQVKILKIEDAKKGPGKKISLSMKALAEDPWDVAKTRVKDGAKLNGKVVRIQPFGAFVEILPGVEGLIHVSNMSLENVKDPNQVLKVGDEVEATVVSTDWTKRRVGLSLVKTRQELAGELRKDSVHEGTIERIESFGLFVKLPSGARGLVPGPETGKPRGTDLQKEFQKGQAVKVSVLDIERKSGKIRMSIRRAAEAEERAEYSQYLTKTPKKGGFGTLGDLLKDVKLSK